MINERKIAVLTDSGTDVPQDFAKEHGVFIVPLAIQYSHGTYYDGETISAQEVYDNLTVEIPKTSLPSSETIDNTLRKIHELGYETVFIITISSALSGTFNLMRLAARDATYLDCRLIDTRNIGIGAGFSVLTAVELIEAGYTPDEIEARLNTLVPNTKVFFCVSTLEYLAKGGRIGRVTATVGALLDVRPVISCSPDGVYYTVQKARGAVRALNAAISNAVDYAKGHSYILAIAHGGAPQLAKQVEAQISGLIGNAKAFLRSQVSPALGVHTGPGLIGIGVQRLD